MKKQSIIAQGHCGLTVELNLMDQYAINHAVERYDKYLEDKNRQRQMEVLIKGYNEACDSINQYGVAAYSDLVMKYCKVKKSTVESLKNIKFEKISKPREKDIECAQKWLSKK